MALFCLFVILVLRGRTEAFRSAPLVVVLLVFGIAGGCGGGNSGSVGPPSKPGTPPGSYTLTVSASAGSLTHTATVTLIVN
jgi:hypothetical protein